MGKTKKLAIGVLVLGLAVLQGVTPASAQSGFMVRTAQALAPGVSYSTLVDASPRNVIHVARVASGAPVTIKAVAAPANRRGPSLALPSVLCRAVGGVVCVNGDFFGRNGVPLGGVLVNGRWVRAPTPVQQQLWLDGKNHFSLGAMPAGARQSLGATRYPIVQNGHAIPIPEHDAFASGRHARTLIGWDSAGNSLLVSVEQGRGSAGMSLAQAANLMLRLGATTAANEDGGGSSQFVVNGVLRNVPSEGQKAIANIWAVIANTRR